MDNLERIRLKDIYDNAILFMDEQEFPQEKCLKDISVLFYGSDVVHVKRNGLGVKLYPGTSCEIELLVEDASYYVLRNMKIDNYTVASFIDECYEATYGVFFKNHGIDSIVVRKVAGILEDFVNWI